MKKFEKMTFEELVEYQAGKILKELLAGNFKQGVFNAMELAVRWRVAQKDLNEDQWR